MSGKLITLNIFIPLPCLQISLTLFNTFLIQTSPYIIELNTFKICMQKCVSINYAAVSSDSLDNMFGSHYQHQVIKLMRLWTVHILLPNCFYFVNELWNTSGKTPLSKQNVFGMASTLWCQLYSTLLYWGIHRISNNKI